MAVTDEPSGASDWDLAWPQSSTLATVVRNDTKPGRQHLPGLTHWVVHATASLSQAHLEMPAADALAQLQAELVHWLGQPLTWHHAAVHRWRYASMAQAIDTGGALGSTHRCWWDADLGLGVCGDALGGEGIEGAWCSAHALADLIIDHQAGSPVVDP
jgi:predicted NAD/FAD-dependent oxidoreductase